MPVNEIIDVRMRSGNVGDESPVQKDIYDGLSKPLNQKTMPTLLLYNEEGLRIYDEITTGAPEYYLFGAEEHILKERADEIARTMHSRLGDIIEDETVVELGAG
jgi:uncharacterized SAM-dependent methyltransferase